MIQVVVDRPYQFVPPHRGTFWARAVRPIVPSYLRRSWGVETIEFHGGERLKASLDAGHGVLIAPNHARPCDPFVIGLLPLRLRRPCHFLAAWHIFTNGSRFSAWLLRRIGAFSINRWSMDRESLKTSIQILSDARRPLMLFPEGMITRANDRLGPLLDGMAFIARSAARHRAKLDPPGQVVVHPVMIRYIFDGDLHRSVGNVLDTIERRIGWQPQRDLPLIDRVRKLGDGILSLKEAEYLDSAKSGPLAPRVKALIEAILQPMEKQWLKTVGDGPIVERVKRLRTAFVPGMTAPNATADERMQGWEYESQCYLAQQLDCYPPDYLAQPTTAERVLETVERYEEDLTDKVRTHRPLRAIVEFDEAILVDPTRDRDGDDALTARLRDRLNCMLNQSRSEAHLFNEPSA